MLQEIIKAVRNYEGVTRKNPISYLTKCFDDVDDFGKTYISFGDDCAVLKENTDYLLFAADGIWRRLMENDPRWAGYCAVLANVNDIYAMGGRPIAMTNILSTIANNGCSEIVKGINDGCKKFRVPMVGGHLHPSTEMMSLSISIIGKAKRVLTSFDAMPGQDIVLAIDITGERHKDFFNWDSTSMKSSKVVVQRLEKMVEVAEKGLATSAKDISNPGLLGTIGMLLETSAVGAEIDIDSIPCPENVSFIDWIKMYPGFGFIMTTEKSDELIKLFGRENVECKKIGRVNDSKKLVIKDDKSSKTLFDFNVDKITGIKKI